MVWPVTRPAEEVSRLCISTSERAAPKDRPPLFFLAAGSKSVSGSERPPSSCAFDARTLIRRPAPVACLNEKDVSEQESGGAGFRDGVKT